jgi:predicted TIM-barrel fold metal-dependent hydrolase
VVVDVHCHVGQTRRPMRSPAPFSFEAGGWEAFFSDSLIRRVPRAFGKWLLGVEWSDGAESVDAAIERFLLRHILNTPSVDRVVLLAFDAYHGDDGGAFGLAATRREPGTHMYVSNTYIRDLSARHPDKLWFGASVHPYRRDAIDAMEEVAAAGAVLIKWLPLTQNIDAADPRAIAFLEHAARIRMPILVHYGGELSLPDPRPGFEDPAPMLESLRRLRERGSMPTVIVAHAATPSAPWSRKVRYFDALCTALLGEFRDAPLYTDLAALATWNRSRWLKRLVAAPELHAKLVYGSDFPIPPFPILFRRRLGRAYHTVRRCESLIERDVQLKRRVGLPEVVFTRMGEILKSHGRIR